MKDLHPSARRPPPQCIVPPYMIEHLAHSADPRIRERALGSLAAAAAIRAVRAFSQQMPIMLAAPSPTGRKHRLIYDAGGRDTLPGRLVRSEGEKPTGGPAVNEAYDHSGATFDFFHELFGRNSLDDAGMALISSVHVGEVDGSAFAPMNNAFWDGSQMAYGDGDGVVFQRFTRSLDVVAHELTHGVQAFTSNLVYRGQSGAINEHFADVFGVLVRQWRGDESARDASWLVGAEILVAAPTRRGIRDMEFPGTAYADDPLLGNDPQPAHMKDIYTGPADFGGVHINSGILNRAFVLAAKSLGGRAWEKAGKIWYQAMLQLPRAAQFGDLARATAQIAGDDFGLPARKVVKAAWKKVGL